MNKCLECMYAMQTPETAGGVCTKYDVPLMWCSATLGCFEKAEHEFTLNSAEHYDDGTPIRKEVNMKDYRSEPEIVHDGSGFCGNCHYCSFWADGHYHCEKHGIVDPDDSSCEDYADTFEGIKDEPLSTQIDNAKTAATLDAFSRTLESFARVWDERFQISKDYDLKEYVLELEEDLIAVKEDIATLQEFAKKVTEFLNSAVADFDNFDYRKTDFFGKPDREECKHCPKAMCDNCMNYPF